jgi:serine/threonine-protein kinase
VVALLQEGRVTSVYRAEHVRTHRPVAVKVLAPKLAEDEDALARFAREAESLAALEHPQVVQVLDFDRTPDGHAFLATELLEGTSLEALLAQQGALPHSDVARITMQIASALATAHRLGLVHADLRPHNVFVTEAGRKKYVKLLDFGLSQRVEHGDAATPDTLARALAAQTAASAAYHAPEQLRGASARVGPAADQFALACIVYEMLTGGPAFTAPSASECIRQVLSATPAPPSTHRSGISEELDQAVLRALSKDPAARFEKLPDFAQVVALACDEAEALAPPLEARRAATAPSDAPRVERSVDTLGDGAVHAQPAARG